MGARLEAEASKEEKKEGKKRAFPLSMGGGRTREFSGKWGIRKEGTRPRRGRSIIR